MKYILVNMNHPISECSKSTQKEYEMRHDWVEKIIHWELCKKLKFDHKWSMYKQESVQENETHKIPWDFEIQTDPLISARRPDLMIVNKKKRTRRIVDFADPADHRVKSKENEKRDKYLDLTREIKKEKTMEYVGDGDTNCGLGTISKCFLKSKDIYRNHPDNSLIKIGQNTEKSPGDNRKLVVTQAPVKDH